MAKKKKSSNKAEKSGRFGAWVLLFLLGIGGLGLYNYFQPASVLVPSLVGKTQAEAEQMLDRLGLKAEVRAHTPEDETATAGQVLRQAPAAQTAVPKRSVVTLYVADVPAGIDVPEVVGKTRSEAEDVLRRAGFEVSFTEATSDAVEVGKVISQTPTPPAKLSRGQTVKLTVSGGKGQRAVPDLRELPPAAAREQLSKVGLELVILQVAQAGFREGDRVTVLRQEPKPGTKLPAGSRVTVFIPIPAPVQISPEDPDSTAVHAPRLEGLTVAQARDLAKSEGVILELAEAAEPSSVVTFQDPPPGDPLPKGSGTVLIRTAVSAVVPGLAGLSEQEARAKIESAELTVGSVKKSYGPVKGEVLGQRPSAGIEVLGGSQVDLVVADPSMAPDAAVNAAPQPTPAFTPAPWVD